MSRAAGPSARGQESEWWWAGRGGKGGPRADLLFVSGEERADGKVTATQTLINELVACMEVEDAFGCTLPPPRAFHSSIN